MSRAFFLFPLAVALSACMMTEPRAGLRKAETLLREDPDSCLSILERIAPQELPGRRLQAAYTLLHAQAQEAVFGFIPTEEGAELAAAAEYLEQHGSREERRDVWSCLGRVQYDEGALHRAVVSLEKALAAARQLHDEAGRGEICRRLAYTYNASLQHVTAARYLYDAYEAYRRAGQEEQSRKVLLEYGQAWYNFERYQEAEDIFRTVLADAHAAADTLTEVRCLQSFAALALEKDPADPGLARDLLGRVTDDLHYPLGSTDWGVLAYTAALEGRDAEARRCLDRARAHIETVSDRNRFRFREYQVAARAGRTAEALRALEQVASFGHDEDVSALRSAVSLAHEDYIRGRASLAAEQLKSSRRGLGGLLLLILAAASTMLWYLRARKAEADKILAQEQAETERYIGIAEELQSRLTTTRHQLKQASSGRNEILERLCEQYYIFEGTDKLQKNLLREVKQAVEGLRDDPKVLARLESALDATHDQAAARLRAQLPNCKEEDVKLFVLAASGFSRTAMAALMDKEKGVVNNRLWRLKGRIEGSAAPDKELLLSCLD